MEVITVVIPCFNCEETVEQTVASVLSQRCDAHIEIVLVNDGSSDSTQEILERLSQEHDEVTAKHLEASSGRPSIPRNVGLDMAQGDFVCFMDADDLMPEGYLAAARMVITNRHEFSGSLKHSFTDRLPPNRDHIMNVRILSVPILNVFEYCKDLFSTSGQLIPRALIGDLRFQNTYMEDWRFLTHLYQRGGRGRLLLAPRILYRVHAKSLTPKRKTLQVRRVFTVLRDMHGLPAAMVMFGGYFLIGSLKLLLETKTALRVFGNTS